VSLFHEAECIRELLSASRSTDSRATAGQHFLKAVSGRSDLKKAFACAAVPVSEGALQSFSHERFGVNIIDK